MNLLAQCEGDTQKLLILQDELSSHFDVQFALLPYQSLERISHSLNELFAKHQILEMREYIKNRQFFLKTKVELWKKWIEKSEKEFLERNLVDFSGENPAFQILRTNYTYRIIETIFVVLSAEYIRNSHEVESEVHSVSGEENKSLSMILTKNDNAKYFLVIGPSFILKELGYNREIDQRKMIIPFGELAKDFLEEHECRRLLRYGVLRSIISEKDAKERISQIAHILESFKNIEADDYIYGASVVRTIVRILIGYSLESSSFNENSDERSFIIPLLRGQHENRSQELSGNYVEFTLGHDEEGMSGIIEFKKSGEASLPQKTFLTSKMSKIADQAHTNFIDQRLENLLVFRGWVFDYMGDISSRSLDKFHGLYWLRKFVTSKDAIVEAIVCAFISRLIRADIVTFYHYDHRERSIEGKALYFTNSKAFRWSSKQIGFLRELNNIEEIKNCFLYQCCSSGKSVFSNNGEEVIPKGFNSNSLSFYEEINLETPGTILILPVKHGNRVFGAIECVCFKSFAFDRSSIMLIDEFSELFGKFFIAQANSKLLEKVRVTTAPEKWYESHENRFDDLACAIADYFLVHSATVWLSDAYNSKRMVLGV